MLGWLLLLSCREDPDTTVTVITGQFGDPGSGWTVQCSGWYPDWITRDPPTGDQPNFQLAQGYSLGVPVFAGEGDDLHVDHWDPPSAAVAGPQAPWLAFDFATQPAEYLEALRGYILEGFPEVDFVAQENTRRRWYHVPMMTSGPANRREPLHGVTKERLIRDSEHTWITGGDLNSYAIGYYNALGSYTLGQVFRDENPALSEANAADFIDGTVVFKLLFAEYNDPFVVDGADDPLVGAPEWTVRDVGDRALKNIRLLQVDVAVKDSRTPTAWVFGTWVYDKLHVDPSPWGKLTAVGLQWHLDPTVSALSGGVLTGTWINPARPAVYAAELLGHGGRLNGPVDNPDSSCMSCHATSQVDPSVSSPASLTDFRRLTARFPSGSCTTAEQMAWFRDVPGGAAWGVNTGCAVNPTAPATTHGIDYSLQLQVALESALYFRNVNPCAEVDFEALAQAGEPEPREKQAEDFRPTPKKFVGKEAAMKEMLGRIGKLDPRAVGVEGEGSGPQR